MNEPNQNELEVELSHIADRCALIDGLVLDDNWGAVIEARDSARAALERGHQLWPVAAYAEYRMALDGPPEVAVSVLDSASMRFALGPFPEVVATTHLWADLAPHVPKTPGGAMLAHEFVAAGERLATDVTALSLPNVFDIPLELQAWEPTYVPAVFHLGRVEHFAPALPMCSRVDQAASPGPLAKDPTTIAAFTALVRSWTTESNGRCEVLAVEGECLNAIAALGVRRPHIAEIDAALAMSLMVWAASGGGAHGRRRGLASARSDLWWLLTALGGFAEDVLEHDDVVHPEELGEAIGELQWMLWTAGEPDTGWALRLAVNCPSEGLAFVISAVDAD